MAHSSNHSSPTNPDSSSNSTTPPSETTLADEDAEFQASRAQPEMQQAQRAKQQSHQQSGTYQSSPMFIHTDYESSAAEDHESYTLSKYENAESALLSYSRTNKLDKLQALLDAKLKNEISLNLNYKGQQKQNFSWSALHLACYFGHIQVLDLLFAKKPFRIELDVNIKNNSGDTPLHKATLTNRAEIVQILLSNGANVFLKNCDGMLAKQLTKNKHILEMLEAAEEADKILIKLNMFKAVDNGDLKELQVYFQNYDSLRDSSDTMPTLSTIEENEVQQHQDSGAQDEEAKLPQDVQQSKSMPSADFINQMTDDRGNTLLHLAAMRGFKAICVYLLEQGFDPYRKNNLGQTCIDISSYQLRRLFMTVKPANAQLRRLSRERVTRFEGPLMKKVRILGWKQIYVVLENGVFLLFNNRNDSMNRSRRGYKYLESASCESDPNDIGVFSVCFSDRSRATFLVSSDHVSQYNSFRSTTPETKKQIAASHIELIRQKWLDSIKDHIVYSTEFIRKGLKLDDNDETGEIFDGDNNDLSNLNHLLPMDTIKSFFHEARAHYNILERHAESLCSLIKSISSSTDQQSTLNSLENSMRRMDLDQNVSSTTSTSGSRLFGLIRGTRCETKSIQENELSQNQVQLARNATLTNEFMQDNWSSIVFHLRLLMESTENTKLTMGQALTLMDHQEQLRQNRIQDQEERCRVLEDSLHALARDHHELEKSLSVSQLYHSVAGCRSISMSTDLNEYHDAFEDFDDEKTMTPDSTPSYEDIEKRIHEVMLEDEARTQSNNAINNSTFPLNTQRNDSLKCLQESEHDEDDDCYDLESNCSALTVETVTDQYLSMVDASQHHGELVARTPSTLCGRARLPAPMVPREQVSIWSLLKNCIGKELSKITMPVVFNEPVTMLQRSLEGLQFTGYLKKADLSDDPVERMELICAFIIASISCNCHRIVKPFNPLLYETFEYDHELEDGSHVKAIAQQVSHHPPITAAGCESDNFVYNGVINPKIKFWGRSIEISHDGFVRIHLKRHNETYLFNAVACSIHNIIVGKLWFEHHGPLVINCYDSNIHANLTFKQAGWFSNELHRFDGFIVSGLNNKTSQEAKKLRFVYGKWSDYIKSVCYSEYEKYMSESQQKQFRIPESPGQSQSNGIASSVDGSSLSCSPISNNNNSISPDPQTSRGMKTSSNSGDKKSSFSKSDSTQSFDIPNSRTLWRLQSQYLSDYYNFTLFTMKLNELTPELEKSLPKTDSRFRTDVRKLEEGDLDAAASEKQRLEDKQREARARDKRFKDPSDDYLFFKQSCVPNSKEKFWLYKGGYWENKCNPEKFPDLF